MINKEFKNNWLKILNFNNDREILKDPNKAKEIVRIPLSPITINANLLYHFFEVLYPKFINDQNNILDVILTDTDKKNKVIGLYLYRTKKAGIHNTVESLPEDLIRIKSLEIENLDDIFNKIQNTVLKEKKVRISSIRIFKKEALDLINTNCKGIEQISVYEFFNRLTYLIQNLIQKDLFLIYPEPIFITFLKKSITLLKKIQMRSLFNFIEGILPEFKISVLLGGEVINTVILLQKKILKSGVSDLLIKFFTLEELGIEIDNSNLNQNLSLIQQKLKTENTYFMNQKDIISFFSDLFELLIPLKKDNIKFLLQKALFGYRSFEKHWNVVPRPSIYNNLVRFFIRLLGLNLNMRKLSHWAIPEIIFNYCDFFIGLNSKILIIITDLKKVKEYKFKDRISKSICEHAILLDFEESTMRRIKVIHTEDFFINSSFTSFDSIRQTISTRLGFISAIIFIDKLLIQTIIQNFVIKHSKISIFPRIKTLKLLKDKRYLTIHPEFPPYKLLKNKRTRTLLKLILPVLIDKHEF